MSQIRAHELKQLIKLPVYSVHGSCCSAFVTVILTIWFTDEKIFTVASPIKYAECPSLCSPFLEKEENLSKTTVVHTCNL